MTVNVWLGTRLVRCPAQGLHDDLGAKQNEQAIRASPNRLLVEDLTAIGYPRPAPLLAASDHVFFGDRTAGTANRSALIYFISSPHTVFSIRHSGMRRLAQARNPYSPQGLWIPGSCYARPGMTAILSLPMRNPHP
jgi:hypothetical protein